MNCSLKSSVPYKVIFASLGSLDAISKKPLVSPAPVAV